MAIVPTNMARLCTDKWQPLWVKLDAHKYCQIFVSPYTWDYLYYYNNEWHNVGDSDMYYYDRTRWVKVTTEWLKLQYSNKVRDFSVTPAEWCVVTLMTNEWWGSIKLNWTIIEEETTITVPSWTSVSVNDVTLTIWDNVAVATPDVWYHFVWWTDSDFWPLPATITSDIDAMAEFMDSPASTLEWLNKVDDEHPNKCVSILTEWDWKWGIDPEVFNTYTDLHNVSFEIPETADWVSDSDFEISFNENEDPDTSDDYPYVCNVSYSGDLSWFDPDAYVATINIQDISWEDVVQLWTLTLNKTGA